MTRRDRTRRDRTGQGNIAGAAAGAVLAAGPLFLCGAAFSAYLGQVPKPVAIDSAALAFLASALILVPVWGALVALLPVTLGTVVMTALSARFPPARAWAAWIAAGAALALAMGLAVDAPPLILFPLCSTGAICAGLCRRGAPWQA